MDTEPHAPPPSGFTMSTPAAILVGAVIIAGAVFLSNAKAVPPSGIPSPHAAQPAVDAAKVNAVNDPVLGNPNAPVTMAYWYDYQCPFCQRNELDTMPQIVKNYVDAGKVKIIFKDYAFLGPDSQTLGQYSRAVWEAAPEKFYDWHHAVYANQGQENSGWATPEKIRSITEGVIGRALTDRVVSLVASKGAEYQKSMDADKAEGQSLGVNGTPGAVIGTKLVSGAVPYAQFQAAIDAGLAAK